MKPIITLILIAISIVLFSCGDKSTGTSPSNDYFPNEVGSVWVYAVYDSLMEQSYDMTVSIADSGTVNEIAATLWVFSGNGEIDTQYVVVSGDTVTFFPGDHSTFLKMYVFPLSLGNSWNCGESCIWNYAVDRIEPIEVPAGAFANAYHIDGDFFNPNVRGINSEWMVPGVGAVRIYRYSFCTVCSPMVDTNEIWELKSYRLAD